MVIYKVARKYKQIIKDCDYECFGKKYSKIILFNYEPEKIHRNIDIV